MALNRSIIQKEKNFWKQHKIKIASTFIAIFIWFLVVTRDSYEYKTTIPVKPSQENPDYVITSPLPEKADVILYGTGRFLLSYMLFREIRLPLDIDWSPGRKIITPTIDNVYKTGNEGGLKIREYLGPDTIIVVIEKLVTKEIPVQNNVVIKPMASYIQVGDVTMEPEVVRVQGPERALAELDSINTPKKTIRDQKAPYHEIFTLIPPKNKQMKLLDNKVDIAVEIQQLLEKKITKIPVDVRYLPQNLEASTVQPAFIDIKLQGGLDIVSRLTADDIDVYVEYSPGMDSVLQNISIPVNIEPIKGVTFREISSDRVKVSLTKFPDQ